jgi:hypothetical protein
VALRGRKYNIEAQRSVAATAPQTIIGLTSTAAIRPYIYDILIGTSATPADNAIVWYAQRFTAAGTSTAYTPVPLDSSDPASTTIGGVTHTGDPTYTSSKILFHLAANQRSQARWIADPDGPLIMPATANNGIGIFPTSSSFSGTGDCCAHFSE